jgi:hypothetical protein
MYAYTYLKYSLYNLEKLKMFECDGSLAIGGDARQFEWSSGGGKNLYYLTLYLY